MSMERKTMTRLTTALVLFLVLGTGFVLGLAVDRGLEAAGRPDRASGEARWDRRGRGPGDRPDSVPSRRRSFLWEQVGLTEAQRAQVDSIVYRYRSEMRALHEEFDQAYMPRYHGVLEESREAIRAILTPEQRIQYDSLLVEHDRRMEERRQDGNRERPNRDESRR